MDLVIGLIAGGAGSSVETKFCTLDRRL